MKDRAEETIKRYKMLRSGDRVTVGISGGADSVALLFFLHSVKDQYGIILSACHVNHNLRAGESDRDEIFVRTLCQKLGILLVVASVDAAGEARKTGLSVEEAARNLRYQSLADAADGGKIATAHTLSDSMETVLINMTRGTGLKGLTGIPPVRGMIIRPLIRCTRAQVENYCTENDLLYITDSTNLSDDYTRNYIRHHLIPGLYRANASFDQSFARMSDLLSEDEAELSALAEELLNDAASKDGYLLEKLDEAGGALLSRTITHLLRQKGLPYDFRRIDLCVQLVRRKSGAVQITSGIYLRAAHGLLFLQRDAEKRSFSPVQVKKAEIADKGVTVEFFHGTICLTITDCEQTENFQQIRKSLLKNALDYDKINDIVFIRARMAGDRLRIPDRGISKPLGKLYAEMGVPAVQRDDLLVLADRDGVIWAEGAGSDAAKKATELSKRLLLVEYGGLTL